jgi:hypothetical protein
VFVWLELLHEERGNLSAVLSFAAVRLTTIGATGNRRPVLIQRDPAFYPASDRSFSPGSLSPVNIHHGVNSATLGEKGYHALGLFLGDN